VHQSRLPSRAERERRFVDPHRRRARLGRRGLVRRLPVLPAPHRSQARAASSRLGIRGRHPRARAARV